MYIYTYVEVPIKGTCECDLISLQCNQVKSRSYQTRVDPNSIQLVILEEGEQGNRDTQRGKNTM